MRVAIGAYFFLSIVFSVCFVKLGGEFPVRTLWVFGGVACIFCLDGGRSLVRFKDNAELFIAAGLFSLSGTLSTLLNDGGLQDILIFNVKWIFQPLGIFLFSYQVSYILGWRFCYKVVFFVFFCTITVGILQGMEVGLAWDLKYFFDGFQAIEKETIFLDQINFDSYGGKFDDAARAKGLSWSPIHLSYQCCLLFGFILLSLLSRAYCNTRLHFSKLMLLIIVIGIIFSGTRSALLGCLCGLLFYFFAFSNNKFLAVAFLLVAYLYLSTMVPIFQDLLNYRVFQAQDSSASMRGPLYGFGILLFLDKPWGYGWVDQSINYAQGYWHIFYRFEGAESIFMRGLHNYLLNILWVYGFVGLVAMAMVLRYFYRSFGLIFIICLSPYLINSLFHNGGIFYGGNYIWIFIGIYKLYIDQKVSEAQYHESSNHWRSGLPI